MEGLPGRSVTDPSGGTSLPTAAPLRVVWVDDDDYVRGYATSYLSARGMVIRVAANGADGLPLARESWADVIVLDLRMPGLTGQDVLRRLRAEDIRTPVVVLTAYPDDVSRALAASLDATFQVKPCVGDALVGLLRRSAAGGIRRSPVQDHSQRLRSLLEMMADPSTPVPQVLACAEAFRALRTGAVHSDEALVDQRDPPGGTWSVDARLLDPRAAACIDRLLAAGRDALKLREDVVARELGLDRTRLGRLLRAGTGYGFREWRWGIALRVAVRALSDSRTSVKEAAFEAGFSSPEKLARGLWRLLGVTPTEVRRLLAVRDGQ